jgi:predicted transcriptional regulator
MIKDALTDLRTQVDVLLSRVRELEKGHPHIVYLEMDKKVFAISKVMAEKHVKVLKLLKSESGLTKRQISLKADMTWNRVCAVLHFLVTNQAVKAKKPMFLSPKNPIRYYITEKGKRMLEQLEKALQEVDKNVP